MSTYEETPLEVDTDATSFFFRATKFQLGVALSIAVVLGYLYSCIPDWQIAFGQWWQMVRNGQERIVDKFGDKAEIPRGSNNNTNGGGGGKTEETRFTRIFRGTKAKNPLQSVPISKRFLNSAMFTAFYDDLSSAGPVFSVSAHAHNGNFVAVCVSLRDCTAQFIVGKVPACCGADHPEELRARLALFAYNAWRPLFKKGISYTSTLGLRTNY